MKKSNLLVAILISVFIISFFLIQISSSKINPILYKYVNVEAERVSSNVVDASVNEVLEKQLSNNLFIIHKNKKGEIETIDYNTKEVNKLLKNISIKVQKKLIDLENGKINRLMLSNLFNGKRFHYIKNGIVCEVPIGVLSSNSFLSNVGPIIPIKMTFLGQVNCNLKTKVKNYGINNLYLEINVHIEIKERITMPKMSKEKTINIDAPLTVKIVEGVVPKYYGGSINQDSNMFSLPNTN